MSYAPHTNTEVANGQNLPMLLGTFGVKGGASFEYAIRPADGSDFAEDGMHIVYVQDGYRYARVLKTVAHVAIDENEDGSPVWEKWELSYNREYDTDWVRKARGWV